MAQAINPPYASDLSAWYDLTDYSSLTLSTGKITTVNDQSGNGHHATQATAGRRPTLGNRNGRYVGRTLTTGEGLDVPSGLSINERSCTIVLATQIPRSQLTYDSDEGAWPFTLNTNNNYLRTYITGKWQIISANVLSWEASEYLSCSPVLIQLACGASTTKLKIDAGTVHSGSAFAAGTAAGMCIGNYAATYTLGQEQDIYGCLIYNRQLTDTEMETVRRWAASYWGVGVKKTAMVICDGDSNVEGGFSSGSNDVETRMYSPPSQIARLRPDWLVYNFAIGATTTAQNITKMTGQAMLVAADALIKGIPLVSMLSNGNDQADSSAAQAVARFTTYFSNMRSVVPSCRRVIATVPPRITPAGFNAWATELNALIASGYASYADQIADVAAIPELADWTDTNYYSADGVHRDENGFTLESGVYINAIQSAFAQTLTAAEVVAAINADATQTTLRNNAAIAAWNQG